MSPEDAVDVMRQFEETIADDATGDLVFRRRVNEILAAVVSARAQTIDRDAALKVLYGRGLVPADRCVDVLEKILALLRPVDGVTLTREEAARAYGWRFRWMRESTAEDYALAARLEAAS